MDLFQLQQHKQNLPTAGNTPTALTVTTHNLFGFDITDTVRTCDVQLSPPAGPCKLPDNDVNVPSDTDIRGDVIAVN